MRNRLWLFGAVFQRPSAETPAGVETLLSSYGQRGSRQLIYQYETGGLDSVSDQFAHECANHVGTFTGSEKRFREDNQRLLRQLLQLGARMTVHRAVLVCGGIGVKVHGQASRAYGRIATVLFCSCERPGGASGERCPRPGAVGI